MRILIALICLVGFSTGVFAVEPVNEQQVMLYYIIPLDADRHDNNKHQFGLRMDQTTHDPGDAIQISSLEKRPAALDFRLGYDGVQSLKLHGVDYAAQLIARATEDEQTPAEVTAESQETAAEMPATGEGEQTAETPAAGAEGEAATETDEPKEKKTVVQEKIDSLPFGVIIGVLLGVGILAGLGG